MRGRVQSVSVRLIVEKERGIEIPRNIYGKVKSKTKLDYHSFSLLESSFIKINNSIVKAHKLDPP